LAGPAKTAAALSRAGGHLKLDAQASAIALTARVGADLAYRDGIAIVTMAGAGLMYGSVGRRAEAFLPPDRQGGVTSRCS
jgi:hypothetical protein